MLAHRQAVYTSRVADVFTGMQYRALLTVWNLYHNLCSLAKTQNWPKSLLCKTRKAVIPYSSFFNQRKSMKERCACCLDRDCWEAKCQQANHICTPGISFYAVHGWNVLKQHGPTGSRRVKPSASVQPAAFSLGSTKNGWLSSQTPPPTPAHGPLGSAGCLWRSRWEDIAISGGGREGRKKAGNNLWLPGGWEAYLRRWKVGAGCCCPGVVGKAAACVGKVKTGRCC